MNEYEVGMSDGSRGRWVAQDESSAIRELAKLGKDVATIRVSRENVPATAPGVACSCDEGVRFCAMHGRRGS